MSRVELASAPVTVRESFGLSIGVYVCSESYEFLESVLEAAVAVLGPGSMEHKMPWEFAIAGLARDTYRRTKLAARKSLGMASLMQRGDIWRWRYRSWADWWMWLR